MRTGSISRHALALALLWGVATAFGGDDGAVQVKVGGYAFWQFGQIVKGNDATTPSDEVPIDHQWTNSALIGITLSAQPHERLRLVLSPEFKLNYPYPEMIGKPATVKPFGVAYINEADGIFSFGDIAKPFLQCALGMFSFKYNPDARNLGEFLYRTGTYPTYIFTDFDFPKARLLGLKLSTEAVPNLRADLLFTSEAFMYPLYDFSLCGIASYRLMNAIEIGAGIDLARLLPAVESKTSPVWTKTDKPAGYNEYVKDTSGGVYQYGYYSFKGTKAMARMSIDPKPFFGSPGILGKEDLKLYGEVTVVGLEGYDAVNLPDSGYPAYYNDLNARTPRMVGLNLPAFKAFDVLAAELEYFPTNIPNNFMMVQEGMSPVPTISAITAYSASDYRGAHWRWSLFMKKRIINGFIVTGQMARDHLRTTYWDGSTQYYECMNKPGLWHWELKAGYSF
jgi:hypothetical protein